jgi:hypothetical protein
MRDILIHHHIFKNAGSSFSSILDHNFGRNHVNIEASEPWGVLHQDEIMRLIQDNPQIKAVSSHTARLFPAKVGNIRFHPMLFLRHPIDRVGSVYSFERRQPNNSSSIGAKIARQSSIKEYVAWRLTKGNGAVIRNFQVVFISGRERDMRYAEATIDDLMLAKERIAQMKVFGLVEFFQESLVKLKKSHEEVMESFEIKYAHQNQSADREEHIDSRIEVLKQALGAALYEELIEKNSLDIELYNTARKLFLQLLNPIELQDKPLFSNYAI